MSDSDLEKALDPVREHHLAQQVTTNTVLAAYLRSFGASPVGSTWQTAKDLLDRGMTFEQAALAAVSPHKAQSIKSLAAEPNATRRASVERRAANAEGTHGRTHPPDQSQEAQRIEMDMTGGDTSQSPNSDSHSAAGHRKGLHRRLNALGGIDLGGVRMDWFPKVFGPGDIDGKGAERLLGTPNVPLSTVLVRETAQNSWDARIGSVPITFSLHLRKLEESERTLLRNRVFTGSGTGLNLVHALSNPSLRVLEISDRGTKGLGGPTQNDVEPPLDAATNYVDLVLNIGAPRDIHLGGGTYGFGKTICYRASRSGTVLIWSRSVEDGEIENRLIGSAIGASFTLHQKRHTGRHWWGSRQGEHRIEPWTGSDASALARAVFDADFRDGETGTSIMIIDPNLGGDDQEEDVLRLSDAIIWNLWPKLLPPPNGEPPMHVELYADDALVPLPSIPDHPILSGHADALQLVRATQNGTTYSPKFNTQVHEVWCQRPKELVGHVGLTRYPSTQVGPAMEPRDTVPITAPCSHVAWMRHDAELVVRYDERMRLDSEVVQWAAVFKPVEKHDDAFASAEPPAHDDWVAASIDDKQARRIVNVGLRRLRELLQSQLSPPSAVPDTISPSQSVAVLADSLSKLIGATPGTRPQRRPSDGGRSSGKAKAAQAAVVRWHRGPVSDGYRTIAFLVQVQNAARKVKVHPDVGVATDGARMHEPEFVEVLGWRDSLESGPTSEETTFEDGQQRWLIVRAAAGVGVDANFSCWEGED